MNGFSQKKPVYVEVAFNVPLRQTFTYRLPEEDGTQIRPGCRVRAPFGRRKNTGFVIGKTRKLAVDPKSVKAIEKNLDENLPTFTPELLALIQWTAEYYRCGVGETAAAAYPFSASSKPREVNVVRLAQDLESGAAKEQARTETQRRVLTYFERPVSGLSVRALARTVGVSDSVVRGLIQRDILRLERQQTERRGFSGSVEPSHDLKLTTEQDHALDEILRTLDTQGVPVLVEGVTGSGKTEVYLQAIRKVLESGKRALVLLPEISLTPQTARRFTSRFGDVVAVLHSGLSQGERFDEWWATRRGERSVVVGARSAIFAPIEDLGLIVVDEEHDGSYKQSETSPRYNARDLAVVRASQCGASVVLGSATPSLESSYNAEMGKYRRVHLRKRPTPHPLPTVRLVDMRARAKEEQILSAELREALKKRFECKQQSILFLNRRGFATSTVCSDCGQVLRCPSCSVALVYHRKRERLICHHCEYQTPLPSNCPHCQTRLIRQHGWGTEKLVEIVEEAVPGAHVLRMDRDTTSRKGGHERILSEFQAGADVLVGTQMVTKGLDIPNVTLVGIVNSDGALNVSDFRAAERGFAQLVQVSGRAGRGVEPGEVFVQTWCPDHYAIQLALRQDYASLFQQEIQLRKNFSFPPFTRLVLLRPEGENEQRVQELAWRLYHVLNERARSLKVLPPLEAPLYRIRNQYRWHIALRAKDHRRLAKLLADPKVSEILDKPGRNLRVVVDVDPSDVL